MAKIFAKKYLKKALEEIDPGANLETLKEFETYFKENIKSLDFSYEKQFGIVGLYLSLKKHYLS